MCFPWQRLSYDPRIEPVVFMENIVLHKDFLLVKYRHNAELNYEPGILTECKEQDQTDHKQRIGVSY